MKRVICLLFLAVFALLAVFPALAQEATAEPTPVVVINDTPVYAPDEAGPPDIDIDVIAPPVQPASETDTIPATVVWAFVIIVVALLAAVALVLRPIILQLGASAPPALVEAALATTDSLLASGDAFARRTPTSIDDLAMTELRREFDALRTELRNGYTRPPTT